MRPQGRKDFLESRLWEFHADLAILKGKADEAMAIFLANRKEVGEKKKKKTPFGKIPGRDSFGSSQAMQDERDFAPKIASVGRGLEMYGIAAFQREVFAALAAHYRRENDADALAKLLKVHAEKHTGDPELAIQGAILDLLRGNFRAAEVVFRAELDKPEPTKLAGSFQSSRWLVRLGLLHAYVLQGKTVEQYRVAGSDPEAFLDLAKVCVLEKATKELDALLAVHRKLHPNDPLIPRFAGEAAYLNGDYASAWAVLNNSRMDAGNFLPAQFRNADFEYGPREKALVCLVRSKRIDEAVRVALDRELNNPDENPIPMILAHAAAGDV